MLTFLKYQLYLLQLENYEISRYFRLLFGKGYFLPNQSLRKDIVWTAKSMMILMITALLIIVLTILGWVNFGLGIAIIILLLSVFVLPIYYTISFYAILPIDFLMKTYLISIARKSVKANPNVKIIGIAGSYGKTTMKSVLEVLLSSKYRVAATPESVNTPVGISKWLVGAMQKNPDVLIIEMGEHYKGDIKYLCSVFPPDIAVITGINEAHAERIGKMDNAIETIFEICENAKKGMALVMNADDENVMKKYEKYAKNLSVSFYGYKNTNKIELNISDKKFDDNKLVWFFKLDNISIETVILGEYILGTIMAATIIGRQLGLNDEDVRCGLIAIKPVEHRLQPIRSNANILVIDDSYNGNTDGVNEAINLLEKFKNRRKIYLTPGLVEMGEFNEEVHREIGKRLSKVADLVILTKNSVTPYIEKGLLENGFGKEKILWFETAQLTHRALPDIMKPDDVILFQNDWGDQYL